MADRVLVYAPNGAQMAAGTKALIADGHRVRVCTRRPEDAKRWLAAGAESAIVGAMDDLETMKRASDGCDGLYLLVPFMAETEEERNLYGQNAVTAAMEAGIGNIVWNTGGPILDEASEGEANACLLRRLKHEDVRFIGLTPISYMENLFGPWTLEKLTAGILAFPTPVDFKVQWGAAKDFGQVASKGLQNPQLLNSDVTQIGGPEALDGHQVASIVGRSVGSKLSYEMMDPRTFESHLTKIAGARNGQAIGGLYTAIQENPAGFQPIYMIDSDALASRFDIKLTSLEEWAVENRNALGG